MWTEKHEAHAAKMRARFANLQSLLDEPSIKRTPGNNYVYARMSHEDRLRGLKKVHEANRQKGDVHREQVLEIPAPLHAKKSVTLTKAEQRKHYPVCPRCPNPQPGNSIRAGVFDGIQRYRCTECRRTYSGPTVRPTLEVQDYKLLCHRCGSTNTARQGRGVNIHKSGLSAFCLACKHFFMQGGTKDFQRYHLLLEKRVMDANLPKDVEDVVYQQAVMDVLAGKGYCWTVELKIKEAFRECRGEYGQRGSDHPAFRSQQGQKMYDD